MRLTNRSLLLLAALLPLAAPSAQANEPQPPWCAVYGGGSDGGGGTNCGFFTLQQCRETISGMGGFCEPNPFYNESPARKPGLRKRPKN